MADHKEEGLFGKPKQLIVIVLLAFIIPIAIAVLASQWVTSGKRGGNAPEEQVAARIQPVAKVELSMGNTAGVFSPEEVYTNSCSACHATGAAGAPKLGDKAAWAPRIAGGLQKLVASAIKGKNAMPPKGGASLSDEDFAQVVAYLANQSGANFKTSEKTSNKNTK